MTAHRRRFLRICGVAGIGAFAGCVTSSNTGTPSDGQGTPTPTRSQETPQTPAGAELEGTQVAKLTADDGESDDIFGDTVAVSREGTTAVISAPADTGPNGEYAGSAYVFERTDGSWRQQVKLTPDDRGSDDYFGEAVTVSDDGATAIIGAYYDADPNGEEAGSAYVFDRAGDSWNQQAKLTPEDGNNYDLFGCSAALSGDGTTAIIGARDDEDPNGPEAGSAYVFDNADASWSQQAKLNAKDGDSEDNFGTAVAVSREGTTAIIGANNDEDPNGSAEGYFSGAGSAYAFEKSDGTWSQQAKLVPDDGDGGDNFGVSVAVSRDGTTALIGADVDEDPNGEFAGSAYIFRRSGGTWTEQSKLTPDDGNSGDAFGSAVALTGEGTTALIGAPSDEEPNGIWAGSAYIFENTEDSWTQQQKLAADDGDKEDNFGVSVAAAREGTTALIGAFEDEDPNGDDAGSAYVFE